MALCSNLPTGVWRTIDKVVDDSVITIVATTPLGHDEFYFDFYITSFYLAHWGMPTKIKAKEGLFEIVEIMDQRLDVSVDRRRFLVKTKIIEKYVDNTDDTIILTKQQIKEKTMNYSTAVLLINDKVQLVKVSYELDENGKPRSTTTFKTFENLSVGDFVVVPTTTRLGMTVCRVEEIDVDVDDYIDYHAELNWVVSKVAKDSYDECLRLEQDAIKTIKSAEKRRKREELRKNVLADLEEKDLVALPIYSQQTE